MKSSGYSLIEIVESNQNPEDICPNQMVPRHKPALRDAEPPYANLCPVSSTLILVVIQDLSNVTVTVITDQVVHAFLVSFISFV